MMMAQPSDEVDEHATPVVDTVEDDDDLGDEPPPLKISCTATKCEDDLHCFRATRKMQADNRAGSCRECGANLVDWGRVHEKDLGDVDHTFGALRRELIRHHFWHIDIDRRARDHATRKGRRVLYNDARRRLDKHIRLTGNPWDGRQTPFVDNSIFYAQHATASCCRRCIEYWHGMPADRDLTDDEVDYLHGLITRYLDERLPDLDDDGQHVPRRRR